MMGILGSSSRAIRYKWFPKNWVFVRISKNHQPKTVIAINNKIVPNVVSLPVRIETRLKFPFYKVCSIYRQHCGHRAEYMMFDENGLLRCGICGEYR